MKDYLGYQGKTCVVTGAASGIGRACAEALVDLGAVVYALDINPVDVPGIERYDWIDMGNRQSIDDVFARLPERIDCFFGIAGVSGEHSTAKETILVNFVGNQYAMRTYLTQRVPKNGAILICTSVGGNRWASPVNRPELEALVHTENWEDAERVLDVICDDLPVGNAYTYSKRAMTYFTLQYACEMAEKRVRVNVVKPGHVKSGLTNEFKQRFFRQNPGGTDADYDRSFSLKTEGAESMEMALPAIFLNSDMASYLTGVELVEDYGMEAAVATGYVEKDLWTGTKLTHPYPAK